MESGGPEREERSRERAFGGGEHREQSLRLPTLKHPNKGSAPPIPRRCVSERIQAKADNPKPMLIDWIEVVEGEGRGVGGQESVRSVRWEFPKLTDPRRGGRRGGVGDTVTAALSRSVVSRNPT